MNQFEKIKRGLLPAIKGIPILLVFTCIAMVFTSKIIFYATPMYESTAKLKLDDISHGFSSSNLYKDFDVFTNTNKLLTEIEVLKSSVIIEKAAQNLGLEISYFRKGMLKTTELYQDSPFLISFENLEKKVEDKIIEVKIENDSIQFTFPELSEDVFHTTFQSNCLTPLGSFKFHKNKEALNRKPNLKINDQYQCRINSKAFILNTIIGKNLEIHEIDKDIAVVRISFKHPVPQVASDFVKELMNTYLTDYIGNKSMAATKTVTFIDQQLQEVSNNLKKSEIELEQYRNDNYVLNTKMETETGLKKISELSIQLVNIEMTEASLDTLDHYINHKSANFIDLAPNFDAQGGLLFSELMKRLKLLQSEKKDLLAKYTPNHEKIEIVDQKMNDIILYIKENIKNNKKSITIQKNEIKDKIELAKAEYESIPTKEKEIIILERNFKLNQDVYNFLVEKKTEADIAAAATIAFHRIIQHPKTSSSPVHPNKSFLVVISGFVAILCGLLVIYSREILRPYIRYSDQIEQFSSISILATLPSLKDKNELQLANLQLIQKLINSNKKTICIRGIGPKSQTEGIIQSLLRSLEILPIKTALINISKYTITKNNSMDQISILSLPISNIIDIYKEEKQLNIQSKELKSQYDLILYILNPIQNEFEIFPTSIIANTSIHLVEENITKQSELELLEKDKQSNVDVQHSIVYCGQHNSHLGHYWHSSKSKVLTLLDKLHTIIQKLLWR